MQLVIDIKIQSFSDIITNSSSEIFSIRTKNTKDEIEALISTVHKGFLYKGDWNDYYNLEKEERAKYDHFSGDGGRIDVKNFDDRYKEFLEYFIPEDKKELFTKEIYSLLEEGSTEEQKGTLKIYLDEGFTRTLDWIIENLYVTDIEGRLVEKVDGRVVKLLPWDDYIED